MVTLNVTYIMGREGIFYCTYIMGREGVFYCDLSYPYSNVIKDIEDIIRIAYLKNNLLFMTITSFFAETSGITSVRIVHLVCN